MADLAPKQLNGKEKAFVDEYLIDMNATAAGIRAGYAETTANKKCPLWVCKSRDKCPEHKLHIWDAVHEAKQGRSYRTKIDSDWLLKRLAEEAEADILDLYDSNNNLLPIKEWPEIWRKGLVAGVDVEELFEGFGKDRTKVGELVKIKVSDRVRRLELIGKHIDVQAFPTKVEHSGPGGGPIEQVTLSKEEYIKVRKEMMKKMTVETEARKFECELDGLYFNRFFLKQRFGSKMIVNRHHPVTQNALDRTMLPPGHEDFISRLIINVPPGYTKTELASIGYMARGLAINPMARFLHLSYSDKLVLLNSGTVREIVKSQDFQNMWPVAVKADTDSKKIWHTDVNGGITATAAGGQVTGFRAGHMDAEKFTGALVIDDPVKPDDAYSDTVREGVNNSYNETVASRVAIETIPIIVIMQRIHWNDLSGYLLAGGSGEMWHHLCLPVKIDNSETYPKEYTHGIPIAHGLEDGWLWPFKHNDKHAAALESHRRKYNAQYKQKPLKREEDTVLWTEAVINAARVKQIAALPIRTVVGIDPATTNTEKSDEHGIIVGSEYPGKRYSLDADYSRKGSPKTWAEAAIFAYDDHNADAIVIETNQGGDMCEDTLRNAGFTGKILRVHAKKGKTLRAEPVVALYELGMISHKAGLSKVEDEMQDFDPVTQKSNGKSPNRVDASVYVISELAGIESNLTELLNMAIGG